VPHKGSARIEFIAAKITCSKLASQLTKLKRLADQGQPAIGQSRRKFFKPREPVFFGIALIQVRKETLPGRSEAKNIAFLQERSGPAAILAWEVSVEENHAFDWCRTSASTACGSEGEKQ
jgi:hypothetical protein